MDRKVHSSNPQYASFCIYIEIPAVYRNPQDEASIGMHTMKSNESFTFDSDTLHNSLMRIRAFRNREEALHGSFSQEALEAVSENISAEVAPVSTLEDASNSFSRSSFSRSSPAILSPPSRSSGPSDPTIGAKGVKFNRILVVDDAALVVKMTVRMLKGMNISKEYLSSQSGSEAIQIVESSIHDENQKIDAIFLDYVMPVVNGPTVAATIRQMGWKGLIIGVTALTEAADQEVFMSNGADIVADKPLQPAAVQEALNTLVSRMERSHIFEDSDR